MFPPDYLSQAADMYRYKHSIYGDNYRVIGKLMTLLFPNGLTVKSETDWNRLHLFIMAAVKMTRYANNYEKGGHEDSVMDNIVYMAMLQEIDEENDITRDF